MSDMSAGDRPLHKRFLAVVKLFLSGDMSDAYLKKKTAEMSEEIRDLESDLKAAREERDAWKKDASNSYVQIQEQGKQLAAAESERSKWIQAVGMLSTLKPSMEIDVNDPTGMATQICEHVNAAEAEVKRLTVYEEFIGDTEDFECLDTCDSYGHDPLCPATEPMAAYVKLREQLAAANERAKELERVTSDLRKIRDLIEALDADAFGEGSTTVTAPDGEAGLIRIPAPEAEWPPQDAESDRERLRTVRDLIQHSIEWAPNSDVVQIVIRGRLVNQIRDLMNLTMPPYVESPAHKRRIDTPPEVAP